MTQAVSAWRLIGLFATIFLLLAIPAASAGSGTGDIFDVTVARLAAGSDERVAAFEFRIPGARTVGIPDIPDGWSVEVSNDRPDFSEISGHAVHGVEFLSLRQFVKFVVTVRMMPPATREAAHVEGHVDLYKVDTMRRVEVAGEDFLMVPR
jgi:hypothetical protein